MASDTTLETDVSVQPAPVLSERAPKIESKQCEQDMEKATSNYEASSAQKDPNLVDWDGPDDPANPLNWPTKKKLAITGMIAWLTLLSPLGSVIIAPGTSLVMEEFNSTSEALAAFVTSVYLIGYAFGPLVIAPLSEIYGRNPVYHISSLVYLVFSIACAVAPSLNALIVLRLMAGIAASTPITIGAGSIADMIPRERRGFAMSTWMLGPLLGPSFGPLIGGYLSEAMGWRWVFWLMSILSAVAVVTSLLVLRETSAYALLEKKAKALRDETGNPELRSIMDKQLAPRTLLAVSIIRPVKMLFLSPIVFLLSLYGAVIYSYIYLCFTTFPRVFEAQYSFSRGSSGLAYLGIGIASIIGVTISGFFSDRISNGLTARNGAFKPEFRLPLMFLGGLLIPAGLFWYGWSAEWREHYILPIIGSGLLGGGMMIAFMSSSTYLVDTFTIYAASAFAANTTLRSLLAALLPLAGNKMYDTLGVGWGTSVLGFIAVAFLPVPLVFYLYGERIRKSKRFNINF